MTDIRKLIPDQRGESAAEFAMVVPLLLILLFGVIDGGRFAWEFNRAEKATQMGARMAIVTNPVAGGISSADFVNVGGLKVGETIPAALVPDITCGNTTCSCSGCPSGLPGTYDGTAFTNIVTRMQLFFPEIEAENVEVIYRGSGLGYAGDPTGPDVSPLVTVRLKDLEFTPITSLMLASVSMPNFSSTLTAEDSVGTASN